MKSWLLQIFLWWVVITASLPALMAQEVAKVSQALPFATKGKVDLTEAAPAVSTPQTTQPAPPTAITAGGKISTGANGSASVTLSGVGTVQLERNTEIQIPAEPDAKHSLELLKGKLFLQINAEELQKRKSGEFRLKTPTALLAVKGTRFFVDCEKNGDTVGLHDGSVMVSEPNRQTAVTLVPDQAVTVSAGNISALRLLSANEKNSRRIYQEIALVRTPLLVRTYWSDDAYDGGKVTQVSFASRRDWEHLMFNPPIFSAYSVGSSTPQSNIKPSDQTTKTPFVSPLGEVREIIPFVNPSPSAKGKKGNPSAALKVEFLASMDLHLKGNAWRAKNAGLSKIGDVVGLQLHLKLQNVDRVFCSTTQSFTTFPGAEVAPRFGTIVLNPPPGLSPSQEWEQDCVVPLVVGKSGENSGNHLYICAYSPEGNAGAKDTAVITLSNMALVSHAD